MVAHRGGHVLPEIAAAWLILPESPGAVHGSPGGDAHHGDRSEGEADLLDTP